MIKSKGWDWKIVEDKKMDDIWRIPSIESYYLIERWKDQNKTNFLDLGCGLGRHSVLFGKNRFKVYCFDISEYAINRTRQWAEIENLTFEYKIGDMLSLPYENESMDCIYCKNVISHTNTEGIKKIIKEIMRVLKINGECYLTLSSKETWKHKTSDWPLIDENTKLKMEVGPEYKVPHFYADYDLIKKLFEDFEIVLINHNEEIYEENNKVSS
jgi:ubiquinone/menaquinone biosynthesis C-methylase UbiE